jgi:Arc/MetJ family transcription regulator
VKCTITIDSHLLEEARRVLGTETVEDTVDAGLRAAVDVVRREREQETPSAEAAGQAQQAQFRQAMEAAGLEVHWPSGELAPASEYKPLEIEGTPLSEQILADRR